MNQITKPTKETPLTLDDLAFGDMFESNHEHYMKSECGYLCLDDGLEGFFNDDHQVTLTKVLTITKV